MVSNRELDAEDVLANALNYKESESDDIKIDIKEDSNSLVFG